MLCNVSCSDITEQEGTAEVRFSHFPGYAESKELPNVYGSNLYNFFD